MALSRTKLSGPAEYVGRNTLPIYVAHFFVVYPALVLKDAGPWVSVAGLLVVVIAGVGLPLIAKEVAYRIGQRWLFEAPPALKSLPLRKIKEATAVP